MGGGRIIKDATAAPEDVITGKVFYNNKGRQTGNLVQSPMKSMIINLPYDYNPKNVELKNADFILISYNRSGVSSVQNHTMENAYFATNGKLIVNVNQFLYLKMPYHGDRIFMIPHESKYNKFSMKIGVNNTDELQLNYIDNTLHFNTRVSTLKNTPVEIFYI